jgi:hypothetical protein
VELHQSEPFKSTPAALFHLVVVVIHVLRAGDEDVLRAHFRGLGPADQVAFLNFLENVLDRLLTAQHGPEVLRPANWASLQTRDEELLAFEALLPKARELPYPLYCETSLRIVRFVWTILDQDPLRLEPPVVDAFGKLLAALCGRHQDEKNFSPIMLALAKFVDVHSQLFCYNMTSAYKSLVDLALILVERRLRSARGTAVALLSHFFYIDYNATTNVVVTSSYFIGGLTDALKAVPPFKLQLFKSLIERLRLFITSFRLTRFVGFVQERLDAALKIFDADAAVRGLNQSPELCVRMLHRQADQCFGYPVLRLRFLRALVAVNESDGLLAQAYVGQLSIVALAERAVTHSARDRLPALDFSFAQRTAEERAVAVGHCAHGLQALLFTDPAFSARGLVAEFSRAIDLARRAGLHWHVRECRLRLMTVFEGLRDYEQLAGAVPGLADAYSQVEDAPEPLHFWLVERRRGGAVQFRSVFASAIANPKEFVAWLDNDRYRRFDVTGLASHFKDYDALENGIGNGIGTVEVVPVGGLVRRSQVREFEHVITYTGVGWDDVGLCSRVFVTDAPHPSSSVSVDVVELKERRISRWQQFVEDFERITGELAFARRSWGMVMPPATIADEVKKAKPVLKVAPLIKEIRAAITGPRVKELGLAIAIGGERGEIARGIAERFVNEIELDVRTAVTLHILIADINGESDPQFVSALQQVTAMKTEATALATTLLKRSILIKPLETKAVPLSYSLKTEYEDYQ